MLVHTQPQIFLNILDRELSHEKYGLSKTCWTPGKRPNGGPKRRRPRQGDF